MSGFDEFAEIVGTEKIPEYTLVRISHPWGMYAREIICPDGTKIINNKKNKEEIHKINILVGKKKAKYKVNEYVLSRRECINLAKHDKKMNEIIGRCGRLRT